MKRDIDKTTKFLKENIGLRPKIAVILGSGLGGFVDAMTDKEEIDYHKIPDFPVSTAPSHSGKIIIGKLGNIEILCMQGRFHVYEGYSMEDVTYPIRVLKKLGIEKLLITNASGGMQKGMQAGDFMLIKDHINFMGSNPLLGENNDQEGPRFPDMSKAYSEDMNKSIKEAAKELDLDLKEGTYVGYLGPSFETPSEIKMFQLLGGSAVGMSTVPEVIVANHIGLETAAISCISNLASGILDQTLTLEEVIEIGKKSSQKLIDLISLSINNMYK